MDLRHRVTALLFAAAAFGCSEKTPEQNGATSLPTGAPDGVASGEVAESREEAFGLLLPVGLRVTRRDYDMVTAEGSLRPEEVSNYVRSRIQGGSEETGPGRTTFLFTTVLKPTTGWRGTLRIDVEGDGKFTHLRVFGAQAPVDAGGRTFPSATADVRQLEKPPGENAKLPPKL